MEVAKQFGEDWLQRAGRLLSTGVMNADEHEMSPGDCQRFTKPQEHKKRYFGMLQSAAKHLVPSAYDPAYLA